MGKSEILQELARLSPEDLAEVRARLDQLAPQNGGPIDVRNSARIRSPRLANRSKARDFIKQVTELAGHAKV